MGRGGELLVVIRGGDGYCFSGQAPGIIGEGERALMPTADASWMRRSMRTEENELATVRDVDQAPIEDRDRRLARYSSRLPVIIQPRGSLELRLKKGSLGLVHQRQKNH